jgi:hypothetical protein
MFFFSEMCLDFSLHHAGLLNTTLFVTPTLFSAGESVPIPQGLGLCHLGESSVDMSLSFQPFFFRPGQSKAIKCCLGSFLLHFFLLLLLLLLVRTAFFSFPICFLWTDMHSLNGFSSPTLRLVATQDNSDPSIPLCFKETAVTVLFTFPPARPAAVSGVIIAAVSVLSGVAVTFSILFFVWASTPVLAFRAPFALTGLAISASVEFSILLQYTNQAFSMSPHSLRVPAVLAHGCCLIFGLFITQRAAHVLQINRLRELYWAASARVLAKNKVRTTKNMQRIRSDITTKVDFVKSNWPVVMTLVIVALWYLFCVL